MRRQPVSLRLLRWHRRHNDKTQNVTVSGLASTGMDVSSLIEFAVSATESRDVEITSVDEANVTPAAVAGLMPILIELTEIAGEFCDDDESLCLEGRLGDSGYQLMLGGWGRLVPANLLDALNRALEKPEADGSGGKTSSGIHAVARLASQHRFSVRFAHDGASATAYVGVPERFLLGAPDVEAGTTRSTPTGDAAVEAGTTRSTPTGDAAVEAGTTRSTPTEDAAVEAGTTRSTPTEDAAAEGLAPLTSSDHLEVPDDAPFSKADPIASDDLFNANTRRNDETEEFLRRVFEPLAGPGWATSGRLDPTVTELPAPETSALVSASNALQVRVPGENFTDAGEDEVGSAAGEAAVEIRIALTDFELGRTAAADSSDI